MGMHAPLLLVGNSVRYLAQSARAAGAAVIAVDAFADLDTQLACRTLRRAAASTPQALSEAVQALGVDSSVSWLYGAGFEVCPALLASLNRSNRKLLGNDAKVLQLLADAPRLFSLLAELDIAHPEISLACPPDPDGWLFKAAARFGGVDVCRARDRDGDGGEGYYQKFIDGTVGSLLFAADGRDVRVIGCNRLITQAPVAGDFRYAGAISGLVLSAAQRQQLVLMAQRLAQALGLRGVNGLDFVMHGEQPLFLELNARPPATLELYESSLPSGGVGCHVAACAGRLPPVVRADAIRGMQLVYASRELQLGAISWSSWVTDRPADGGFVSAGAPLCTVHAAGSDARSVARQLMQRMEAVRCLIHGSSEEAA